MKCFNSKITKPFYNQLKRVSLILTMIVIFWSDISYSQEITKSEKQEHLNYHSIGISTSTFIAVLMPKNLTYEYLHTKNDEYSPGGYIGITMTSNGFDEFVKHYWIHFGYSDLRTLKPGHYIDSRLGLNINLSLKASEVIDRNTINLQGLFIVFPLISASYRYQKPEGRFYYRAGISTGGFLVGIGVNFLRH